MPIAVIVCDDHPVYARGLAAMLEQEHDDIEIVAIATTAADAEHQTLEHTPDVVIMDICLPGVDGIEATRRIHAGSPSTRVVVVTASDDRHDLYQALRAGASGYVVKEADATEIARVVRAVSTGQLVIPSDLAAHFVHDLERADPSTLSDLERDILAGIGRGETNREMGQRLHLSERTVRRRVEDIYAKLHLTDRLAAALYAAKRGLSDEPPAR